MDVAALSSAYDRFIDAARELRGTSPPEGEWTPEMVLAHVIVSDRMIAETVAQALSGGQPRFDNRASHSAPYLEAVAAVAGSWAGLLAGVRQAAEELMALAARIEPEQARVMVPTYSAERRLGAPLREARPHRAESPGSLARCKPSGLRLTSRLAPARRGTGSRPSRARPGR